MGVGLSVTSGEAGAYLAILAALLLGAISPGPSFVMVAHTALGGSRSAGLRVALGVGLGGMLFASLALVGLVALLSTVEWLFTLVKIAGGIYLLYIAVRLWLGARTPFEIHSAEPLRSTRSDILRGLVVQLSNPKTVVVYTAVFAAMLPSTPSLWLTIILAPSVFVIEAGWYSVVALGLSFARLRELYRRAKSWVDRCAAVVMGALGLRILFTAGSRNI